MMMTKKHSQSFLLLVLLFCGWIVIPAADTKKVKLHFDGKAHEGEVYLFQLTMQRKRSYMMTPAGLNLKPSRKEEISIYAKGQLVFESLSPFVVQFTLEELIRVVDQQGKEDFSPLAGSVATIRESGITLRNIPLGTDASVSVLGDAPVVNPDGKKSATSAEIRALVPKAKQIMREIFAVPSDSPDSYLGKERNAALGESWNISAQPMMDAIEKNGLTLSEKSISATARYLASTKISNIKADMVHFLAESNNIPNYDFKLEIAFAFPSGEKDVPLRMQRSATELVETSLPEGIPGFSGSFFRCVNEDTTDMIMIRESLLKKKKGSLFGLFD